MVCFFAFKLDIIFYLFDSPFSCSLNLFNDDDLFFLFFFVLYFRAVKSKISAFAFVKDLSRSYFFVVGESSALNPDNFFYDVGFLIYIFFT